MPSLTVKGLIDALSKENPKAIVVVRSFEEGSTVRDVSSKEHASDLYWKGDSPVGDSSIPTVVIGALEDCGYDCGKEQYEKILSSLP